MPSSPSALRAEPARFADRLRGLLSGRVCVLGVGNRDRGDDGAGSVLAGRLALRHGALSIDAGMVPENYLEKLARQRPDIVLILDAADFGGIPGEARVLDPTRIGPAALSTHALSLGMTADYLKARSGARLWLLAIQPTNIGWGTAMSEPVSRTVDSLQQILSEALGTEARS